MGFIHFIYENLFFVTVEAPKNPWKICPDPVSPVGSLNNSHNINAIITAEKKQKENFSKMLSKPLVYTQVLFNLSIFK